jgi:protein tyrosine/serine phosphatase
MTPQGNQTAGNREGGRRARVRVRRGLLFLVLPFLLLAAAVYWDFEIQANFGVVVPAKLYRSGQPGEEQLEEWIREYGLRSILDFRHSVPVYEKTVAERYGVRLYHLPFSARTGLTRERWQEIRDLLTREENLPLLYHCQSGSDRTGLVTALYRMEVQGWPLDEALQEMRRHYHFPFQYPVLQEQLKEWSGNP